jgi:D-glycero-alpha-D-manno-heptose-7-phosphate kinase
MILARAPLRISIGGGGTDLPSYYERFGGFILSAAINRYVYIYLNRPCADDLIRIKYSKYEQVDSVDQIQHDLVRPALELLKVNGAIEIVSMADAPDGTGLGSSGSYLVALLSALFELKREKVPTQALAEMAVHIEMDLASHPVGKHDHYLAAFGGITCLDIEPDGRVCVTPLNISINTAEELRNNLLLFFTRYTRQSREILQEQKDDTLREASAVVESLHNTKEIGRRIKTALETGDLDLFGQLLDEHWQNKKRRSAKISNGQIDHWYALAKESGALGGKVVGAGGGGFLMIYCANGSKAKVRQSLSAAGLKEMPFDFDFEGAKILVNF